MKPIAAFPYHDREGYISPKLIAAIPKLKKLFSRVVVGITPTTVQIATPATRILENDHFFEVVHYAADTQAGEHLMGPYRRAGELAKPQQVIHLCCDDRLIFALQPSNYALFYQCVKTNILLNNALFFTRSTAAWKTHPAYYQEIEAGITAYGEELLNVTLDWVWCHLAISGREWVTVVDKIRRTDFGVLGEIALQLKDNQVQQPVDWLSWEDPFILGVASKELYQQRTNSVTDHQKRLSYAEAVKRIIKEEAEKQQQFISRNMLLSS